MRKNLVNAKSDTEFEVSVAHPNEVIQEVIGTKVWNLGVGPI